MDAFIGEIRAFPFTFIPNGWFACDGKLYAISEFSALYSLLGTVYGGDGMTNFAVPDLRGRSAVQCGNGPLGPIQQGQVGGADGVGTGYAALVFNANNLPEHSHSAGFAPAAVQEPVQPQIAFRVSTDPATAPSAGSAGVDGGMLATSKPGGAGSASNIYSSGGSATTTLSNLAASASGGSGGGITGGTVALASSGGQTGAAVPISVKIPAAEPPYLAIQYGICINGMWPSRP